MIFDLMLKTVVVLWLFIGMLMVTTIYTIFIQMWSESKEEIKELINILKSK